jgi:transglutaminase-like putative cysteine protease
VRKPFLLLIILILLTTHKHYPTPFATTDGETACLYTSEILYTNKGNAELLLREELRSIYRFPNSSWQTTYLSSVSHTSTPTWDLDQNQILLLDIPPLSPGENVTLYFSLNIVSEARPIPDITVQESKDLSEIPSELDGYYEAEGSWQVDDEVLRSLAEEIQLSTENSSNVLLIVTSIADWIGKNVEPGSHDVPLYPLETYTTRKGDCDDQANLLITLCRILKIPAYLQIGFVRNLGAPKSSTSYNGHVTSVLRNLRYHAWALIYIPPWGWLPFDMTLGWRESNPLKVITSAMVWRSDVIVMYDVIHSDWASLGRTQKEYITSNPLYISLEDSLNLYPSGNEIHFWEQPAFWIAVFVPPLLLGGYFLRRKYSNKALTHTYDADLVISHI